MKFSSLNFTSQLHTLEEAAFKGLAPDGSLFMPTNIPMLDKKITAGLPDMSLHEIAFNALKPFVSVEIPENTLQDIVLETFSFDIPLVKIENDLYVLELFHGPTQSFKDVGARFLSRLLGYFNKQGKQELLVLTATSGDTGGAVAHGFHNVPGVGVVVLYPRGKISPYQEYQITNPGNNVHAIAVNGDFDDCQRLVKEAFNDDALRARIKMTSANSINIGRLLPQMVYYFHAVSQLKRSGIDKEPVITVPSGNFGNITAGMIAVKMGLPVSRFIAATNANDVVPRYLTSGNYSVWPTIPTLANAMDVGNPSNFCRVMSLYNNDFHYLTQNLSSVSIDDDTIKQTIVSAFNRLGYLMDPHTATAHAAYSTLKQENETGIILSTAHPFKFSEILEEIVPGALEKSGCKIDYTLPVDAGENAIGNTYPEFKSRLESLA